MDRIEVPYWGEECDSYDGLGIEGFDRRCNFDYLGDVGVQRRCGFLQEWIFFGSLVDLMAVYDLQFDKHDFIHVRAGEDGQRKVITTERLPDWIAAWAVREVRENPSALSAMFPQGFPNPTSAIPILQAPMARFRDRYAKIRTVLVQMSKVLVSLEEASATCFIPILESIILLRATLQHATWEMFRYFPSFPRSSLLQRFESRIMGAAFEDGTWCPTERRIIHSLVNDNPYALYMCGRLARQQEAATHEACTDRQCVAFQVDEQTYSTKHVHGCCDPRCPSLGPNLRLLSKRIAANSTPSWRGDQLTTFVYHSQMLYSLDVRLNGLAASKFVAVSHVWADGMGCPDANLLPACQLEHIQSTVNMLFERKDSPVPFWIDTLGIPRDRETRRLAIDQMGLIYKHATKVLVFDKRLEQIDAAPLSSEEICLHIMCSAWARRVWTLQEGRNQERTYFRFRDGFQHFPNLKSRMAQAALPMARLKALPKTHYLFEQFKDEADGLDRRSAFGPRASTKDAVRAVNPMWSLIEDFFVGMTERGGWDNVTAAMALTINNIAIRDCSRPGDEALVLSSVGRFSSIPPSKILQLEPDARYKALFSAAPRGLLPIGLLFLDQQRYEEYGSRWIPRTILSKHSPTDGLIPIEERYVHARYGWPVGPLGPGKEEGIGVSLPCFEFECPLKLPSVFALELTCPINSWSASWCATIRLPGHGEILANQLEGEFAIVTLPNIWSHPTKCKGLVVRILPKDKTFAGAATKYTKVEALIHLEPLKTASPDQEPVRATFSEQHCLNGKRKYSSTGKDEDLVHSLAIG